MIRLDIINDGTGNEIVGNYDVMLFLPTEEPTPPNPRGFGTTITRVEHHTRSNGWDSLVYLAVKALQQQMKGGEQMTETTKEGQQEVTIRFSTNGNRQDVLGQVGQYLRSNTETYGLNMEAIELNGEKISSDEVMTASNDI